MSAPKGLVARLLLGLSLFAPIAGIAAAQQSAAPYKPYRRPLSDFLPTSRLEVVSITSGNSIRVRYNGEQFEIRLLGVLCADARAEAELGILLAGQSVYLEYSPSGERDETGGLAAYVYRASDGLLVNLDLVARGICDTGNRLGPQPERFAASLKSAKSNEIGTWGEWDRQKAEAIAEERRSAEEQAEFSARLRRESFARVEAARIASEQRYAQDKYRTQARTEPRTEARTEADYGSVQSPRGPTRRQKNRMASLQIQAGLNGYMYGGGGSGYNAGGGGFAGYTATGIPLHVGPRGGVFHYSSGGNKEYHPELRR